MTRIEQGDGWTIYNADCLDVLPTLEAGSADAVVTDPPYGTTACKWDTVIPFAPMWAGIKHIIKRNAAVVLFGSQPFTSALVMSNPKWFRYELIWEKTMPTGFLDANRKPMRNHENILMFAAGRTTYNPQMRVGRPYKQVRRWRGGPALTSDANILYGSSVTVNAGTRYPYSVFRTSNCPADRGLHPTQKPVALLEYLIRTYTNWGELVLDFAMGSGATGVACLQTGRRFIGVEIDPGYFDIACRRIEQAAAQRRLAPEHVS